MHVVNIQVDPHFFCNLNILVVWIILKNSLNKSFERSILFAFCIWI